jgi:hypothetical protein
MIYPVLPSADVLSLRSPVHRTGYFKGRLTVSCRLFYTISLFEFNCGKYGVFKKIADF